MKALLLMLGTLSLFNDAEYTSQLPAHNQRTEYVNLGNGKWSIEVFTDHDNAVLSCSFWHLNNKLLTQEHTHHCFATFQSDLPAYIVVDVVNNENHMITYKLRSGFVMSIK